MKIVTRIEFTEEEKKTLKKALDLLTDFELKEDTEDVDVLNNMYDDYLDGNPPYYNSFMTCVDFLGMLVELGHAEKEEEKEN